MSENEQEKQQKTMTRREFLRKSGYVAGGAVGGGILGGLITSQVANRPGTKRPEQAQQQGEDFNRALMFFSKQEDFQILSDAAERIFPEDDLGPGAKKLGVPYFIDHQLAGAWGHNAREYMQGPFYDGTDTQGYQSHLDRREIFGQGISKIQAYSKETYDKPFTELSAEEQDEVLTAFEEGKVEMQGITSKEFFDLLRSSVIEGAYADPLYGGNANMDGWRMKKFPGNQMSYTDRIESEFEEIEPRSLRAHMQQE